MAKQKSHIRKPAHEQTTKPSHAQYTRVNLKTIDDYGCELYSLHEINKLAYGAFLALDGICALLMLDTEKEIKARHVQMLLIPVKDRLRSVAHGLDDILPDEMWEK